MSDVSYSAIYYPYSGIRTQELLKAGLLLWDRVEYIAPFSGFTPTAPLCFTDSRLVSEAMDILLVPHVPTAEEQETAHETIVQLVESDLADRLRNERFDFDERFLIYPQKFSAETWQVLQNSQLAQIELGDFDGDFATPAAIGLVMMSVLAESCAGSLKRTVTDQHAAYTAVRESFARNVISPTRAESDRAALVDVSLRLASLDTLPLSTLVALRRRELQSGGQSITELRHAFVARIDEAARRLSEHQRENDRQEIQRQFEDSMRRDFLALREELGGLAWKVVFSRELAVGMLSTVGLIAQPAGQMLAGVAALLGLRHAYKRERQITLANHAMSWLYVQR